MAPGGNITMSEIDRGLRGLIEKIEMWPGAPASVHPPTDEGAGAGGRKKRATNRSVSASDPRLSSSLRAPKCHRTPSMADTQPQRYNPTSYRGMRNPVPAAPGPGCYAEFTRVLDISTHDPRRQSASFRSTIPRNIPFGSSSLYGASIRIRRAPAREALGVVGWERVRAAAARREA